MVSLSGLELRKALELIALGCNPRDNGEENQALPLFSGLTVQCCDRHSRYQPKMTIGTSAPKGQKRKPGKDATHRELACAKALRKKEHGI